MVAYCRIRHEDNMNWLTTIRCTVDEIAPNGAPTGNSWDVPVESISRSHITINRADFPQGGVFIMRPKEQNLIHHLETESELPSPGANVKLEIAPQGVDQVTTQLEGEGPAPIGVKMVAVVFPETGQ